MPAIDPSASAAKTQQPQQQHRTAAPVVVVPVRQSDGSSAECVYAAGFDRQGRVVDETLGHIHGRVELKIPHEMVGRAVGFSAEVWQQLDRLAAGLPLRYEHDDVRCSLGGLESLLVAQDDGELDFTAKVHRSNPGAERIYELYREGKLFFSLAYDYEPPGEDGIIRYINLREISVTDNPVVRSARVKVLQSRNAHTATAAAATTDMATPMETSSTASSATAPAPTQHQASEPAASPAAAAAQSPAVPASERPSAVPSFQEMTRRAAEYEQRVKAMEAEREATQARLLAYEAKEAAERKAAEERRAKEVEERKRKVQETHVPLLKEIGVDCEKPEMQDVVDQVFVNPDNDVYQQVLNPLVENAMQWKRDAEQARQELEYYRGLAEANRGFAVPSGKRQMTATHANNPISPSANAVSAMQQRLPSGVPTLPKPTPRSSTAASSPQPQTAASTPVGSPTQSTSPSTQQQQQFDAGQMTQDRLADIMQHFMRLQSHDSGTIYGANASLAQEANRQRLISVKHSANIATNTHQSNAFSAIDPTLLRMALAPVDSSALASFFCHPKNKEFTPPDENDQKFKIYKGKPGQQLPI